LKSEGASYGVPLDEVEEEAPEDSESEERDALDTGKDDIPF